MFIHKNPGLRGAGIVETGSLEINVVIMVNGTLAQHCPIVIPNECIHGHATSSRPDVTADDVRRTFVHSNCFCGVRAQSAIHEVICVGVCARWSSRSTIQESSDPTIGIKCCPATIQDQAFVVIASVSQMR